MPFPETSRSSSGPARIRFGVFELDRANQILYRNGAEVKLQPQPMAILLVLIERAPEEVSREELQERVWPSGTFVEFEAAIATAIRKIRQALGDSAENPIFIKTAYRRGFRFIAPIHFVVSAPEPVEPAPPLELVSRLPATAPPQAPVPIVAPAPAHASARTWLLPVSILAAILAAGAAIAWIRGGFRTSPPPSVTPLTSFVGDEYWPSFSPDGTQVAFTWAGENDDNVDIYIVEVGGGHGLRRLTTDPGRDQMPAWSPDGHWIAYLRSTRARIVSPLGGPERVLGAAFGDTLTWTPDSKELVMARPAANSYELLAVSLATGDTRQFLAPDELLNIFQPVGLSSDGKLLVYARKLVSQAGPHYPRLAADQPTDLYVQAADHGTPQRLTRFAAGMRGWTWIPGTHEVVVCSNQTGDFILWRASADHPDREPQPVSGAEHRCGNVTAAASHADPGGVPSTLLAYEHRQFVLNLNVLEVRGPGATGEPEIRRILPSSRVDAYPQFSPDGKKLVFISDRSGFNEIWMADSSGLNPVQVSSFGPGVRQLESPAFSPDGREILYLIEDGEGRSFCVLPAGGGKPKRILEARAQEVYASWSEDGSHLYLASIRSGSWQIWKLTYNRNAGKLEFPKDPFTPEGALEGHESPDGKDFYYVKPGGDHQLWVLPADGSSHSPRRLIDTGIYAGWWFPAPGGIFFLDPKGPSGYLPGPASKTIAFFDVQSGRLTPQAAVRGRIYDVVPNFTVSRDGKRVVFGKVEYSNIDLSLLRDFR